MYGCGWQGITREAQEAALLNALVWLAGTISSAGPTRAVWMTAASRTGSSSTKACVR